MEIEFDNFIGIFKNAYSKEFCNDAIELFNIAEKHGYLQNRNQAEGSSKWFKDDVSLTSEVPILDFDQNPNFMDEINTSLIDPGYTNFFTVFWKEIYPVYRQKYSALDNFNDHKIYFNKMQRTSPGSGYHVWHNENSTRGTCNRILTYILYLNDVEDGGETEFLYYPKRIKPEAGTLILWPAGFTHTHRGNQPLTGDKYIMTGWVEM